MGFKNLWLTGVLFSSLSMADSLPDCDALSNYGITAYYFSVDDDPRFQAPYGIPVDQWGPELLDQIDKKFEKCEQGMGEGSIRFLRSEREKFFDEREEIKKRVTQRLWYEHIKENVDPVLTYCDNFFKQAEILESFNSLGQQIQIILISTSDYEFLMALNNKIQELVKIADDKYYGMPRYNDRSYEECNPHRRNWGAFPELPWITRDVIERELRGGLYKFDSGFSFFKPEYQKQQRKKLISYLEDLYKVRARHGWRYDKDTLASEIKKNEKYLQEIYEIEKKTIDECKVATIADINRYKDMMGFDPCDYGARYKSL